MAFLLDTNLLSELRKGTSCHPAVRAWAESTADQSHFISVLSLGEIRKGIEILRRKSPEQCPAFEAWLARLCAAYENSILPVTDAVADRWGRLNADRSLPVIDGLIAATALEFRLTVVTRNTSVFPEGVPVVNPWGDPR